MSTGAQHTPEESLTIEALVRRLKLEPHTVKIFLEELAAQVSKEYLTMEELAKRLSMSKKTVKNKMASGIFKKGVHYFSPPGIGPRFKWSAIVAWLEESEREKAAAQEVEERIPMARGYYLGSHGPTEKVRLPS